MLDAREFCPDQRGCYASLDADDKHLICQLIAETLTVLDEPTTTVTSLLRAVTGEETTYEQPQDVALQKLLPPMSLYPPEAQSLRALTEDGLRSEKSVRLRRLGEDLRAATLESEQVDTLVFVDYWHVWDWLVAINDLRLVLVGELEFQGAHVTKETWEMLQTSLEPKSTDALDSCDVNDMRTLHMLDVKLELEGSGMDSHHSLLCAAYVILTWWQDSLLTSLPK